jgi:hypothetical protein
MPVFAGKEFTHEQIKATRAWLLQIKAVRTAIPAANCHQLMWLINVAINRRAGAPDMACRKQDSDYWWALQRDCQRIRAWANRRARVYSLETPELRKRYKHLCSRHEDF